MIHLSQINPVTDFVRNYKAFLARIKETGNPEVLTVNGKPEYVILDAGSYEAIANELERARFIRAVNQGIEDMRAGRGLPVDEAFKEIRADLGL
ncbi:MAG: type II toxin-antitoxin system Phd/YefM family antitoxin [Fimbriimonadales bacterium]